MCGHKVVPLIATTVLYMSPKYVSSSYKFVNGKNSLRMNVTGMPQFLCDSLFIVQRGFITLDSP